MNSHVRWVEIDHRALAHNVKALKAHVGPPSCGRWSRAGPTATARRRRPARF